MEWVLTAPWVDDAKRKAAADLLAYLQAAKAQAKFQSSPSAMARPSPAR